MESVTDIDEYDGMQMTIGGDSIESESDDEDQEDDVLGAEDLLEIELPEDVVYCRMPCMAHTLQLVIK